VKIERAGQKVKETLSNMKKKKELEKQSIPSDRGRGGEQ
jgi:hypothetical protein